tara:strand:- start:584 stop:739 length:156 start_codon:yes stop_codon:yes gene_type:complete
MNKIGKISVIFIALFCDKNITYTKKLEKVNEYGWFIVLSTGKRVMNYIYNN